LCHGPKETAPPRRCKTAAIWRKSRCIASWQLLRVSIECLAHPRLPVSPATTFSTQGRPPMQESSTKLIYDFHSMFYDATFGRLVKRRIARAINHMDIKAGERVLDLGIGTGVSLHYYPRRARV